MTKKAKIIGIVGIIFSILIFVGAIFVNTASFKRGFKTFTSNLSGGIPRVITVYDSNGKEVKTYEGTADIEVSNDRLLWEDENGLRHQIILGGGFVTIDEVKEQ